MSLSIMKVAEAKDKLKACYQDCFEMTDVPNFSDSDYCAMSNNWDSWSVISLMNKSAYISFGAIRKDKRGEGKEHIELLFKALRLLGATDATFVARQNNLAMQILALKNGFRISGVTTGKDGKVEVIFWRAL